MVSFSDLRVPQTFDCVTFSSTWDTARKSVTHSVIYSMGDKRIGKRLGDRAEDDAYGRFELDMTPRSPLRCSKWRLVTRMLVLGLHGCADRRGRVPRPSSWGSDSNGAKNNELPADSCSEGPLTNEGNREPTRPSGQPA